ncbi:MAG: hypothetical protein IJ069_08650 [Prevotella sp.]|nr:hypothetical protein [Prevotella sp.]
MFSLQYHLMMPTQGCTKEDFYKVVGSDRVKNRIAEFRRLKAEGNDKEADAKKRSLPIFIYQATFEETASKNGSKACWRKQQAAHLNGLVMLDIDHIDHPGTVFMHIPRELFEDGAKNQVMLVHVTPSGKGLRVVFKADAETGDLSANQHAFAKLLGVEPDEACKDASRASFAPQEDEILYINDNIFEYQNEEYEKLFGEQYRKGQKTLSNSPCLGGEQGLRTDGLKPLPSTGEDGRGLYRGIPYSKIIDEYWKRTGGIPVEGERNVKLHKLAVNLRSICDNKRELLLQVMPRLGLTEQELASVVDHACKEPPKGFSRQMRAVLKALGVDMDADGRGRDDGIPYDDFARRLKPLLCPPYDVACAGVDDANKLGAVFVAGAMYCTLMTRCYYRHYDGRMQRMNPQVYIIGEPASGKSFATRLDKQIMAAMKSADEPARQAEEAYKKEAKARTTSTKEQKKAALERPEGMIRYLPSRTSNHVFYRRQINAKEVVNGDLLPLHLYTFDSELDSSLTAQSGGAWIGKHDVELKAFHNEESGVDYANGDSVNGVIPIFWNQVITGTPISLSKKVTLRNINDGLCTRIAIFRMVSSQFQMMPKGEQRVNHEQDVRLKQWGFQFEQMRGELSIGKLVDHVYALCEQTAVEAALANDTVLDYLRKRAVFYATWFTIPRIYGRQWENYRKTGKVTINKGDLQFATLIYDAVLYFQDYFFGQMLEDSWENATKDFVPRRRRNGTVELYEMLPDQFKAEDMMRAGSFSTSKTASNLAAIWQRDGLVRRVRQGVYQKIVKRITV